MRQELQETPELRQLAEGRRILVVDDEPLIRDLCSRALDDYEVLQAATGQEALTLLEQQRVDVVLTDIMMPNIDGLVLLHKLKSLDPTQVVIIMTGFAEKNLVLQALKENADDFITKPIQLLQLKTAVRRALDKKRLREELIYLRSMDHLKSDFLGLVSHKLKTPATAISLFLQNLAQGIGDPQDPEFRRYLDLTLQEADYLRTLIEELLRQSALLLQGAPAAPAPTPLAELLATVLQNAADVARQHAVTLLPQLAAELPTLTLDSRSMAFALGALLDNAIKFSPTGGRVTLSASPVTGGARILVEDQGRGIPEQELPKVFEKFYQVDPGQTGQMRGFGLGLTYARQIIHNHRGTLALENRRSGGLRAIVTLPD